jgi:hypothetical protein
MSSRTPYREPAARPGASAPTVREQFAGLIALAQLLWLDLCVVRIALDLLRGSLSVEGALALALAVVLAVSLVRGWLRSRGRLDPRSLRLTRGSPPAR